MGQAQLIIMVNSFLLEFLSATIEKSIYMMEEKLLLAFKMFDLDNSGTISKQELKEVLGSI